MAKLVRLKKGIVELRLQIDVTYRPGKTSLAELDRFLVSCGRLKMIPKPPSTDVVAGLVSAASSGVSSVASTLTAILKTKRLRSRSRSPR